MREARSKLIVYARYISIALAIAAYTLPFIWAHYSVVSFVEETKKEHPGQYCGMPIMAVAFITYLASAGLSLVATALNYLDYRKSSVPRTSKRKWELKLSAAPLVIFGSYLAVFALVELFRSHLPSRLVEFLYIPLMIF